MDQAERIAGVGPTSSAGRNRGFARNVAIVARREYLARIRTRTFLVATLVLVLVALALAFVPIVMRAADRGSTTRIGIVAADPALGAKTISLLDAIVNQPPEGTDATSFVKPYRFEMVAGEGVGARAVEDGQLSGLLIVARRADGGLGFTYRTQGSPAGLASQVIQYGSFGVAVLDWTSRLPPSASQPFAAPSFEAVTTGGPTDGSRPLDPRAAAGRIVLATILIVVIFITMTIYGMWVATSVAAEKGSRVMELLVAAATPSQLLVGKILGVGGAGLTQYLAIIGPAALITLFQDPIARFVVGARSGSDAGPLVGLTLPILLAFATLFLLGFVLYALLYAAAGSLVNRADDVQQLALPLSLVSMGSYLVAILGLSSIGSGFVRILSFVPFSSPFVMLARLVVGRVEPWELGLALLLLVATSAVVLWVAARVYATGVVLYGQRPSLRTFIRAARATRG